MKNIIFILLLNALFFLVGCGTLYNLTENKKAKQERINGYDPLHVQSCGPTAIKKAYLLLGQEIQRKDISKEIRQDGNFMRSILSIFSHHARSITFPSEIIKYFESHNFKVKSIKSYNQLKNGDIAIVLIKKNNTLMYHWVCFPYDINIESFFGAATSVLDIYLIARK